ncbi:MAG TPA: iron-sulfur cluster assembly protein [Nitrososphaerales archaeon]|nr:iron-sulfur cluster assembly protein [Nitrososphaerales archaeon]
MPSELSKTVVARLDDVVDEETKRKLGELNIVTDVSEMATGSIRVKFQPLSAYSPTAVDTGRSIKKAVLAVDGVRAVRVECSGHMMDDLVNRLVNEDEAGPKPQK